MALRVKEHRVQAKVRIRMGAIIWMKPWGTDSMEDVYKRQVLGYAIARVLIRLLLS